MTTTERVAVPTDEVPAATPAALETGLTGGTVVLHILKGAADAAPHEVTYEVPMVAGMVVLDAVHYVQHNLDTDLACRWNCKAAKCGSCSAEVNGRPVLLCKTRVDDLPAGPVTVHPLKSFPLIKDLVTDVSRNYEVNREIPPFTAAPDDGTPWRIPQQDIDRLYEFRKCIECFLCQDVCHITKCCTEVCPEHIHITDNAIIPLKERVADVHWDPVRFVGRKLFGRSGD